MWLKQWQHTLVRTGGVVPGCRIYGLAGLSGNSATDLVQEPSNDHCHLDARSIRLEFLCPGHSWMSQVQIPAKTPGSH